MVKIEILQTCATDEATYRKGSVLDVSDAVAKDLIRAKYARLVDAPKGKKRDADAPEDTTPTEDTPVQ